MSAEQEQDTAAKSGKKLSALLVMGGVIIMGADTCCSPGCPPKTLHRSRQSISTAQRPAADGT